METITPDFYVLKAMKKYGGGFVSRLAEAAQHADDQNLQRIKTAFPDYWKEYSEMGKALKAQEEL